MYIKLHKNLFSAVLCTCMYLVMGNTTVRFRARKNMKLSEDHVNKDVTMDSLMMCVALCQTEQSFMCQTASWGDGICLLSDTITIHELARTSALSTNENWITMCRVVYPVFQVEGDGGRYSLTFEEAGKKCLLSGTRIASRTELLDARKMGYEVCRCGWLSDGTQGFVLQERDPCWYDWHTGILACHQDLNDAYCKAVLI